MTQQQIQTSLTDVFGLQELARKMNQQGGSAGLHPEERKYYQGLPQQQKAIVQSMMQQCSI